MRRAVRAIVIKDGKLLVMHRNKFGNEYDTLPGGSIEMGESPEEALIRELAEETTVRVTNPRLVIIEHAGNPFGDQLVFLCDYVSGEPALSPDSEEAQINKMGQNFYEPKWVALSDLPDIPFVSEKLKRTLLENLKDGFPEQVVEIR